MTRGMLPLAVTATFLAACGDDDDDEQEEPAAAMLDSANRFIAPRASTTSERLRTPEMHAASASAVNSPAAMRKTVVQRTAARGVRHRLARIASNEGVSMARTNGILGG